MLCYYSCVAILLVKECSAVEWWIKTENACVDFGDALMAE